MVFRLFGWKCVSCKDRSISFSEGLFRKKIVCTRCEISRRKLAEFTEKMLYETIKRNLDVDREEKFKDSTPRQRFEALDDKEEE